MSASPASTGPSSQLSAAPSGPVPGGAADPGGVAARPATPGAPGPRPGAPGSGLPRGVRIGYAFGALATGAFNTVPGLLLLPYLT
ncbi:MAG TPA: hypothetical protein VGD43_19970, partial [Micromonospora sp.]